MANFDEVQTLREKIRRDLGRVNIVVNNAALLTGVPLLDGRPDDVLRIFKVNLVSQLWVITVDFDQSLDRSDILIVAIL